MKGVPKYPGPGPLGATDPQRWRLDSSDNGRHAWHYARDEDDINATSYEQVWGQDTNNVKEQEQSVEAKYWMGLQLPHVTGLTEPGNPYEAAAKGERARPRSPRRCKRMIADLVGARFRVLQEIASA